MNKDYERGWKAGQIPTPKKVELADMRRESSNWYMGFFDAEANRDKYESLVKEGN